MNLNELAQILGSTVDVRKYDWGWATSIKYAEIIGNGLMHSIYGGGETIQESIIDYVKKIRNRKITTGGYDRNRNEIIVPDSLTASGTYNVLVPQKIKIKQDKKVF